MGVQQKNMQASGMSGESIGVHTVVIEGRKKLSVSGVTDIDSFDEQTVLLFCATGQMAVRGAGLQIQKIDVQSGDLTLTGERIDSIAYADNTPVSGGLLGRLFR